VEVFDRGEAFDRGEVFEGREQRWKGGIRKKRIHAVRSVDFGFEHCGFGYCKVERKDERKSRAKSSEKGPGKDWVS
jgi:hypothetical protein